MKYTLITFGCRVNQADSLSLEEQLRGRGAMQASVQEADLVIVNTCSVTATADQGARQTIRRIARENPSARIVATGCYATRRPEDLAALSGALRVVPTDQKHELLSLLEKSTAIRFGNGDGPCGASIVPGISGRTAFTLRVQTGCEERCSYCIIPSTRGRGRSVELAAVVAEVRRIAAAGFKEIALTGVHLGSYGRDLTSSCSLMDLLIALERLDVDVTFRISSLEPMDCSRQLVDLVADSGGRFAPHFHLPLQHASDRILRAMRRPYTQDYYRRLLDAIIARMPHASIGSDMIVGFPGETDADFAWNLEYLPGSPLTHLHVFPYSDRDGTEASRLTNKVDGRVIRERAAELRQIGALMTSRFHARQLGTIRPGLTLEDGSLVVTDNYLKVRIPQGRTRNERVHVRVTEVGPGSSSGVVEMGAPC
jgi:threonylcarbamoyladenosine tRNA methylthiotransferase MtaB